MLQSVRELKIGNYLYEFPQLSYNRLLILQNHSH